LGRLPLLPRYIKLTSERASLQASERASRRDNMKKQDKCTGWAIVATIERSDGTWYDETILDIDDDTASSVDEFLTDYIKEKNEESNEEEKI
tara:strand:+ start:323 stop:598 length:276 start_codon:yes stop_codon:yes gene_type:complete